MPLRRLVALALPAILAAAGLYAVARSNPDPVRSALGDGALEVLLPVTSEVAATSEGTLTVQTPTNVTLRAAPGAAGLVTALHVSAGDTVRTGTPLLDRDGVTVIAAHTPEPFHRPITANDSGTDVENLTRVLVELGHLDPAQIGSTATWEVLLGIGRLNQSLDPQAGERRDFDPASFVWIPETEMILTGVLAEIAAPMPNEVARASALQTPATFVTDDGDTPANWQDLVVDTLPALDLPGLSGSRLGDLATDPRLWGDDPQGDPAGPTPMPEEPQDSPVSLELRVRVFTGDHVTGAVIPLTAVLGAPGRECILLADEQGRPGEVIKVRVAPADGGRAAVVDLPPGSWVAAAPDPSRHRCPQ